jgi:DNA-binding CsgD family transcriptional regulator
LGVLIILVPFLLIYWHRRAVHGPQLNPGKEIVNSANRLINIWTYLPFIFAIDTFGGLMYSIRFRSSLVPEGLLLFYGLVPYILLLFVAGSIADISGRRRNAIVGAIIVGTGFILAGLLKGPLQYVVLQTLMVGGYAFVDVFIWVITADISSRRNAPLFYGAMLGTNMLAILVGLLIGGEISELASSSEALIISLAGLFAFVSIGFIVKLGETLLPGTTKAPAPPHIPLSNLVQKAGFTARELDVARLLLDGASTKEIREKFYITPNTLKSHLRNIYRKTGVHNRLEFTLTVMKDSGVSTEAGKNKTIMEL